MISALVAVEGKSVSLSFGTLLTILVVLAIVVLLVWLARRR